MITVHQDHSSDPSSSQARANHLACVAIGVVATAVGLLPWILTGMRLPLQNLWDQTTASTGLPRVLLPFSQYAITLVFGLIVTAWAVGGLVVRGFRGRLPRRAALTVGATLLLAHLLATAQTTLSTEPGLSERTASIVYLAACVAVAIASTLTGVVVFVLVVARPRAAAVLGWAVAALAVGQWAGSLVVPFGEVGGETRYWILSNVVRWVPAVIVGLAIAWSGLRTAGQFVAAFAALVLLWVGPAVFTAVTSSVGSRVLLPYPVELVDQTVRVFRAALLLPEIAAPPIAVAVVVAAVGTAVHRMVRTH